MPPSAFSYRALVHLQSYNSPLSNPLLGTNPDSETKIPDSETNKSPLRKLEITDSETKTPRLGNYKSPIRKLKFLIRKLTITDSEISLKLHFLKPWGMGVGLGGGCGGGGLGGVISCIPNQAVIVYESCFLVSESGFNPNQGFWFPNRGTVSF